MLNCYATRISRLGLALSFLVFAAGQVKGDTPITISMYDSNSPVVGIVYTASGGGTTSANVYAGAQRANELGTTPVYCIDLTHDNYVPTSYHVDPTTSPGNPAISPTTLNKVAWVVEYADLTYASSGDVLGRSAAQLLIWKLLDSNFAVSNWNGNTGSGSLEEAYDGLLTTMNSLYVASHNYLAGVQFYNAQHNNFLYQDLVIGAGTFDPTVVGAPEPSSMAIAALGTVGLLAYGLQRRTRTSECLS